MADDARQVTTFCPRCGSPVVWSVRSFASGGKLNTLFRWCSCSLDGDEWDDLAEEAGDALEGGDASDTWGVQRVAEEPPP